MCTLQRSFPRIVTDSDIMKITRSHREWERPPAHVHAEGSLEMIYRDGYPPRLDGDSRQVMRYTVMVCFSRRKLA